MGTKVCGKGYSKNKVSGACERKAKVFKSELRITSVKFEAALEDKSSPKFKDLAKKVGDGLLQEYRKSLPGVESVEVTSFKKGSVIADHNIIMKEEKNSAKPVTLDEIKKASKQVTSGGSIGDLSVDSTFNPPVEEEEITVVEKPTTTEETNEETSEENKGSTKKPSSEVIKGTTKKPTG